MIVAYIKTEVNETTLYPKQDIIGWFRCTIIRGNLTMLIFINVLGVNFFHYPFKNCISWVALSKQKLLIKTWKAKQNFVDNHFHNILRLLDVYQIFLSSQVKRCVIITYKHGINELPHKLPNDLRLRILGN